MKNPGIPLAVLTAFFWLDPAVLLAEEAAKIDPLDYSGPAWSPYLVGALIGGLSMLTFWISNRPLGASSAYASAAGLIGLSVSPERTRSLKYFRDNPPQVGWEFMLVVGAILGGLLAAIHGNEWTGRLLPELWQDRFGSQSGLLRVAVALAGGICMAFGARMAGGCTSGHGISGTLQLAVGSWVSAICFFAGGIVTAMLLFLVR